MVCILILYDSLQFSTLSIFPSYVVSPLSSRVSLLLSMTFEDIHCSQSLCYSFILPEPHCSTNPGERKLKNHLATMRLSVGRTKRCIKLMAAQDGLNTSRNFHPSVSAQIFALATSPRAVLLNTR
jgi:hypothetical protein